MPSLIERLIQFRKHRPPVHSIELLKYIGPGLLVTVGFIDPGNWASNVAAGAEYGYALLWMVTLSTIMLILLQHNVAHLGIATGLCLSEATQKFLRPWAGKPVLYSAVLASISTALAEVLGAAIGLNMLFGLPLQIGAVLVVAFDLYMLLGHAYRKLEKIIIGFVSLIGLSFLIELYLVKTISWQQSATGWVMPQFPAGSIPIIMAVLGAVVMPHNLFLHSEIIQSRQWNLEDDAVIKRQLNYEFLDTLIAMIIGWGINSAMIIVAAATFFASRVQVTELQQAHELLRPILGSFGHAAATIFAVALLLAGLASSVTAGMAGGSIWAGIFGESYNAKDFHTRHGILITLLGALVIVFLIGDPFKGLIVSQMLLSVQLPITIFTQIKLTSSPEVMGKFANTRLHTITLWIIGLVVTGLNVMLLLSFLPK